MTEQDFSGRVAKKSLSWWNKLLLAEQLKKKEDILMSEQKFSGRAAKEIFPWLSKILLAEHAAKKTFSWPNKICLAEQLKIYAIAGADKKYFHDWMRFSWQRNWYDMSILNRNFGRAVKKRCMYLQLWKCDTLWPYWFQSKLSICEAIRFDRIMRFMFPA